MATDDRGGVLICHAHPDDEHRQREHEREPHPGGRRGGEADGEQLRHGGASCAGK